MTAFVVDVVIMVKSTLPLTFQTRYLPLTKDPVVSVCVLSVALVAASVTVIVSALPLAS